jgi:hypothetical protein
MIKHIGDYAKALFAGVSAGYATWQVVNHHGTWSNTLMWTLGSILVTGLGTYLVPNTVGGEASVSFPLSKIADMLKRLGLDLPAVSASTPATTGEKDASA